MRKKGDLEKKGKSFTPHFISWWQNDRIRSRCHPTSFLQSSQITPILYNELLHLKTDNRQHRFQLMALLWGCTSNILHTSDCAFLKAKISRNYYIYMCISEHVCMEMFPRYCTTLMHARTQSPEATENKGVEGVKCLAGACSVSLCLSHFI